MRDLGTDLTLLYKTLKEDCLGETGVCAIKRMK